MRYRALCDRLDAQMRSTDCKVWEGLSPATAGQLLLLPPR
jgi:hypothetical protein